ncbi:MAG: PAS domain S-box protein [Sideroxyarcus sp.]
MFPPGFASRGSFKRQIILTFVVGFFALATAFAVYMVKSERASLYRDSANATTGLAQSLAVSSISWVLANDVVGLQEVVQSFRDYPELRYAMVISPTGRVMAHSDAAKVGQFVTDEQSLALVKADPAKRMMRDDESVIDVAVPIKMGKRHVGWARIGLGREGVAGNLRKMIWNVTFFVILATVLSLLAAVLVVNRLGRRIGSLVTVAQEVQAGNFATRVARIPGREDEITRLASSLNLMLDALARNEERLRAASLYTRSLFEASLDPLVTISPEGKITDVNHATEVATGRSRAELVGTDFSDCFAEPDKARKGYQEAFLKGFISDYPLALLHRDGHFAQMLYNASVYQDEKGEVLGVLASAHDITEHRRAEMARSQLAAIVESSSDAIIGKTTDGIITSWNKGAEKIYGYSAAEVVGRHITTLAPAELHSEIDGLLETVRNGGTVENHETERVRKDGTTIKVALTLSPIRDASGKVGGISTIARDITERKRMEQERSANFRYFESMDRVNRAMQGAKDLEGMLSDVLGEVLEIFDCDRVGLVHPCDPHSPTWQIVMERAKPGFSTEPRRGLLPMTSIRADSMQWLLDAHGPVQFTPEDDPEKERLNTFGIRSFMSIAVRPRIGSPWEFGIHQCVTPRTWNAQAVRLFEEIARRLADGLSTMLVNRNLRESEQRYRLVFENSPVSIWEEDFSAVKTLLDDLRQQGVTDLDSWFTQHPETLTRCAQATKILDVNSAAIGLHGATSKEGLLTGLLDTFTPESFETFRHELVCLWNGGTQMAEDAVIKTLGGELRNVTIYFAVCPGYESTLGKVIVSLVDITERKQSLEQIRQSETKYRTLIQNIQTAVVVHAPDTRILISNSQAQDILGLTNEQLAGKSAIDPDWHFFNEDGKPAPIEEYPVNRVLATRQTIRNLVMGVHCPGRESDVWVLVNADPVFDKSGAITQAIVTFIDITERKQAEESLKRMNERFSLASRAASLGVWDWNLQKNELVWNDGMYELYGVKREDFAGAYEAWLQGIHPDDRAASDEISKQAQRGEREYDTEFRVVWPDGSIHYLKAYGRFVRDAEGKPLRMTGVNFDITGRKQAEEKLRRSEHGLSEAQRIAHLGNWELDLVKNVLTWSDEIFRIFEIDPDKFGASYESFLNAIHPDDRDMVNKAYTDSVKNKVPYDIVHRLQMPDGRIKYVNEKCETYYGADGKPTHSFGTVHDITDRILDQQALLRLNRELHAISNCNETLMRAENEQALLDEICRIICEDAGYRMAWVGYPENDEGKTISVVAFAGVDEGYLAQAGITWADTERGRGPSGIAIRSGKSACFQDFSTDPNAVPWRDAALQRGYRSSISMPLKDENANTFGILTIYSGEPNAFTPEEIRLLEELAGDMAFGIRVLRTRVERRQAAAALVQSEYMYRTLAENSPDVIVRYDREGRRIYVNPEFERVNQLTAQQVLGKSPSELSTELKPRADVFTKRLMATMESGTPDVIDLSWVKDGKTIYWYVRVVPESDANGNVVSALTIWSDITERKQAEEEIRTLNHELEQRVAARTAELEAANKELESFSYSVSHDLRTPLRAIDGFSHILLDDYADKLDEEGKRLLNVVRNNTGRMGQLIDDILKFSRAGRLEINYSEIDMEQLAFSVFVELRPVVAGDKLQMEIEHIPPARGDSAMLRQVFVNLLSNAIKFSGDRDAPRILVGATVKDDETIYYVKDNGAGFDMQYADKLFGVFQRLHGVTEFEGTGIGLAIVKRIITRHGGRVWAEGKVGEGAAFYFALPKREINHE